MRVVEIETDMDAAGMAEMKSMFEGLANSPDDVCLDLRAVQFLELFGGRRNCFPFQAFARAIAQRHPRKRQRPASPPLAPVASRVLAGEAPSRGNMTDRREGR